MARTIGFDNEKYLEEQVSFIFERAASCEKLYLEFGGKLLWDYHAARVLPGYDPNVKLRLLQHLKDKVDLLLCIFAGDIERKKIRAEADKYLELIEQSLQGTQKTEHVFTVRWRIAT